MKEIRCLNCERKLGEFEGLYEVKCSRCKVINSNAIHTSDFCPEQLEERTTQKVYEYNQPVKIETKQYIKTA